MLWKSVGRQCVGYEEDVGPVGTYATTEWFVVLFVPLIPLRSYKVVPQLRWESGDFVKVGETEFHSVPMNWGQVFRTYVAIGLILAAAFWMVRLMWWFAPIKWGRMPDSPTP